MIATAYLQSKPATKRVIVPGLASASSSWLPATPRGPLSVSGRPQSLEIVFAERQEEMEYPFDLTIAAD